MAEKRSFVSFTVGLLLAVCLAFAIVLIFSSLVTLIGIDASTVKLVNQIIKIVCIFVGVAFFLKHSGGLLSGALFGLFFVIVTDLIFSAMSGSINFSTAMLWEILFGTAVGGISGIVSAAVRR